MKTIYILLTKSTTICSKVVYLSTKSEYTHSAISLDKNFDKLYTFSRKYKRLLLPAGYVVESAYEGLLGDSDDMRCSGGCIQKSQGLFTGKCVCSCG